MVILNAYYNTENKSMRGSFAMQVTINVKYLVHIVKHKGMVCVCCLLLGSGANPPSRSLYNYYVGLYFIIQAVWIHLWRVDVSTNRCKWKIFCTKMCTSGFVNTLLCFKLFVKEAFHVYTCFQGAFSLSIKNKFLLILLVGRYTLSIQHIHYNHIYCYNA